MFARKISLVDNPLARFYQSVRLKSKVELKAFDPTEFAGSLVQAQSGKLSYFRLLAAPKANSQETISYGDCWFREFAWEEIPESAEPIMSNYPPRISLSTHSQLTTPTPSHGAFA
jgi:hypothetical protein